MQPPVETIWSPPDAETGMARIENLTRHEEAMSMERPRARTSEELVEMFSDDVWRYVSSQIPRREDAEDVVMEVFTAAFLNFGRVERAQDQRIWLFAVARRKVSDSLRKRYRRAEEPISENHLVPPLTEGSELQAAARVAVRCLPPPQGEALVLKYVNGMSTEEVALVIHKSVSATNSLLQRARGAMREALGPNFTANTRSES